MFTGRFFAVILSVLLHAFFFFMLSYTVIIPNKKSATPALKKTQTIKSFLYTPPQQTPEVKPQSQAEIAPKVKESQETIEEVSNAIKEQPEVINNAPEDIEKPIQTDKNSQVDNSKQSKASTVNRFSAIGQLSQLKQRIDAKTLKDANDNYRRNKSVSVLDGAPDIVPHSTKQLSNEEITENATYQLSGGMKTIKGDDGSCSIERDLSAVGMEGIKSVESFNCGTSKFDKSFKDHMKKVQKKLGK